MPQDAIIMLVAVFTIMLSALLAVAVIPLIAKLWNGLSEEIDRFNFPVSLAAVTTEERKARLEYDDMDIARDYYNCCYRIRWEKE